jgi:hypothetical protein
MKNTKVSSIVQLIVFTISIRLRPVMSNYLTNIYQTLRDHTQYFDITGLSCRNIFRLCNQQPENCENCNDPDLVPAFLKKWWVESDFKASNLPLSLRLKGSGCHNNSMHDHWLIVTLKVFWHTSMKKGDNCVCLLNTPWFYKVDILANAIIVAWKWPWLGTGISKEMVGWIRF